MKTPLTRDRLKQHFTYSLWKYALLICCVLGGWNLFYTMTAYRPPQEKIVDIYIYGSGEEEPLNAYMESVRAGEMDDMEQMTTVFLMQDESYGLMILTTRVAAGEGDIYILPKDVYQSSSGEEWFCELDAEADIIALCDENGINLDRCWRRNNSTNERHLYGLPLSAFPGMAQYIYTDGEYYVSVLNNNGNQENVMKFLRILLRDLGPSYQAAAAE